ncbi:MAG: efflux RND transporter periplasmic adaptor subunit [Prevotella sp.]|nr:efflux RND transporter periplasmic adaptor subunit [Candidatus Equicola faecalis]
MKNYMKNAMWGFLPLLAIAVVVLFGLVSCVETPKVEETAYETMKVKKETKVVDYIYSAKLRGKQDVSILPQVTGTITSIAVKEGQMVKAGQLLFVVDRQQYELDVKTAAANTASAKAALSTAKLNYESNKQLFDKGIVSSYVMETALNGYKNAQAAVGMAEAQESQARVNLARCSVTSPVNGIVGTIVYRIGDLVSPSMTEPLTVISDNSDIEAYFALTESDFMAITLAAKGEITNSLVENAISKLPPVKLMLKDGTMYEYEGKIKTFSGVVDAVTGSVSCKAIFPNPKGALRSGISGTVVYSTTVPDIISIPQTAINRLQNRSLVYVVQKDSTVKATVVDVEEINDGKIYAVTSGLNPGDKIVTVGANNLADGQKIKIGK